MYPGLEPGAFATGKQRAAIALAHRVRTFSASELYSRGRRVVVVEVGDVEEGFAEVYHDNFLGDGEYTTTRIRMRVRHILSPDH